jgi:phosphatidylinositol glycan class B
LLEFFTKYKKWFLFGAIVHLLAALFSVGHLHPDEHFQILEFLGFKLGLTPESALPWEYSAKMRPWTQPGAYYLLAKLYSFIGISDRFFWVGSFRLISSLIGFSSLFLLTYASQYIFEKKWQEKWGVILLNTLWFIPFIHARISSEGLGTSFFTIGFALLLLSYFKDTWKSHSRLFLIGLIFGFSFLFRYHIGFMIFPAVVWGLCTKKINIVEFFITSFGIAFAILIGSFIDYWGYGSFTVAPWQYVIENIVHNKAANYGVSPWWDYFKSVFKKSIAPYGLIIILSFIWLWIKDRKGLLTWTTLPFFVIHSCIGHKEWRFLFPLAPFIPLIVIFAISSFSKKTQLKFLSFKQKIFGKILWNILATGMIVLCIGASLKAVHPTYSFFKFTQSYNEKIVDLKYISNESPYNLYKLEQHFFDFHQPKLTKIDRTSSLIDTSSQYWLFTERNNVFQEVIKDLNCKVEYKAYPDWILNNFSKYLKRSKMWALFKCNG